MDNISERIADKIERMVDCIENSHNLEVKIWGKLPRRLFAIFTPLSHIILFTYKVTIAAMLLILIASLFILSTPLIWMEWMMKQYRKYW